jgi:hypothetical protein
MLPWHDKYPLAMMMTPPRAGAFIDLRISENALLPNGHYTVFYCYVVINREVHSNYVDFLNLLSPISFTVTNR